jgi:predicted regulator of Ras-like GTPase activity (Roadblock/LC7/MglB family)
MSREGIGRALNALKDVAGVHGSFALTGDGELLGKDLPAVFQDDLFVEVGERLSRFVEVMAADGDEVSTAALRFDEHRLYVSRFPHGLLAVITENDVNAAALRMALTLTARRIEALLVAHLSAPPPSVAAPSSQSSPALPPVALAGSHGAPRTYRGRVISS